MDEDNKKFSGARLRQARHSRGWSQAELARRAGVRERQIIRWENEQNSPRSENVMAIAQVVEREFDFFFDAGGASSEVSAPGRFRGPRGTPAGLAASAGDGVGRDEGEASAPEVAAGGVA